jgi:hypothetical protein
MAARTAMPIAYLLLLAPVLALGQVQRNTSLETELLAMGMMDQDVRDRLSLAMRRGGQPSPQLMHEMERVDRENLDKLKMIVAKHGWPTVSLVGKEAAGDAFLIVQHGVHDPAFMAKCLRLMEPHLATGEVSKPHYALLYDRTALQSGKKQRYGSQVEVKDGKWTMRPCEDPANVDARRLKMGLPPMKEYLRIIEEVYGKAG